MKKMHGLVLLVFLIGLDLTSLAQSYAFMVLSSKGSTEIKSGDAWNAIKVGELLKPSDEVKVPANGYLGLSHVSGRPLEIREAGNYKVVDLASRVGKGSTAMNKYTDFILSTNQEKKNKLAATGAVHRGDVKPVEIFLPGPGKADLLGDSFSLSWTPDGSNAYTVIIMDLAEEELSKFQVGGTDILIDLTERNIGEMQLLIRVTSSSGNISEKYIIKRLSGNRKKKLGESIAELDLPEDDKSALEYYMLANVYEEKFLLIDALTAYKRATETEPEVDLYKDAHIHFLQRLGISMK